MYKNNETGRTMMEMLMYLSIILILMIGAIKLSQSVLDKFKLSRIGEQVNQLSKGISSRFMAKARYDDMTDQNVINNMIEEKVIPQDMVQSPVLFIHAYGGVVTITPAISTFRITFNNVPLRPCIELGLLNWTINDRTSLVDFRINNDRYSWRDTSQAGGDKALPATVTDVGGSCLPTGNTIIWEFE